MELKAKIEQGKLEKERAEAAKRQAEAKSEMGEANLGAAKAKAIGHADTDASESARTNARKNSKKETPTSGVHGLKTKAVQGKITSGFSLGSGGAHLASKKEKVKKELTAEQLERRDLGILKKKYTSVANEAAAVGARKMHEAESSKTTPPTAGPFVARPTSAFGSRTQMIQETHPKAETSTPFRHSDAKLGSHAPTDRIDSRSMIDDTRQRATMQPRPTPLFSHKAPEAEQYERVSKWNDRNRSAAKDLADSHGNRVPAGGWPKLTGTEENKQKQAIREIDSVLRHPEIQVTITKDRRHVPVIKYRAPEKTQEGVSGVVNTGRGAVYSENGLLHLLSNNRDDKAILIGKTRWGAEKKANKGEQDASK